MINIQKLLRIIKSFKNTTWKLINVNYVQDSNMENNAAESCEIEMKDDISDLKENEESESENYLVIDSV